MSSVSGWVPLSGKKEQSSSRTEKPDRRLHVHGLDNSNDSEKIKKRVLLGKDLAKGRPRIEAEARTIFCSPDGMRFTMNLEQYSTHLLLLGGIGSGKTTVFNHIIRSLRDTMTMNDVMIILDSKGDFFKEFYQTGDIVIGNSAQYKNVSCIWNIYGEVMGKMPYPGEVYEYKKEWDLNAREIMKSLFKERRSSTQPFFADAAADLITMKIISDLRKADLRMMHTYKLKEFFKKARVEDYDALTCSEMNRDFASGKQYYGDGTTPQALAVFAYINSLVSDCFVGVFGDEQTINREFAMRDLVKRKGRKVVFIEYDLSVGEVLGPIYQLLYDQALKEALGRSEDEIGRNQQNVFLICDELKLLGKLGHFDDGLNFGRSLGVKILAGLQSVNQIYDIYGEEKGKVILSGFSNMFCFRTNDAETRKFVSEHFGNQYTDLELWKEDFEKMHIQREGNVVEQWDIQNLARGEAIIDLWDKDPQNPFQFRFSPYRSSTR